MATAKPTILIQLDTDPQSSVFDGVVAVDSGVEFLFRHGGVTPENVRTLIYGAIFTRGGSDLNRSALFIGGSDVRAAESVLEAVKKTFFHPFKVSILFDPNGANTTAAAATLAAFKGMGGTLKGVAAAVLGGTGPVGQRVARLLGHAGARVAVGSRTLERAELIAASLRENHAGEFSGFATGVKDDLFRGLQGVAVVVSAGATGITLLPAAVRTTLSSLKVAIDLNAVPPSGIEGVKASDDDNILDGIRVWGALGVGLTKMKIHKRAIRELFTSNDRVIDAEDVLAIGHELDQGD